MAGLGWRQSGRSFHFFSRALLDAILASEKIGKDHVILASQARFK